MFGTKRVAKRSIIGTRICAPWQDGRFHPGLIQGGKTPANGGPTAFKVQFDDGLTRYVTEHEIVAPGFRSINAVPLLAGQKVFLTQNGREITGTITSNHTGHSDGQDEINIRHELASGENEELTRRREEIRLIESRKSARLQDQDTDYSKLIEMHPEPKKRTVSQVIEVPVASKSRRHTSDDEEDIMMMEEEEYNEDVDTEKDDDMEVMDERMAAMVLTNLSCSPASPKFPNTYFEKEFVRSPPSWPDSVLSSSNGSSGVLSNKSESPSPPPLHGAFGSSFTDEGIEVEDGPRDIRGIATKKRRKSLSRVVFQCTWPGCQQVCQTEASIETHIRDDHIGPREFGESDDSDHEEEFYYTEVEIPIDADVSKVSRTRHSSSPGRQMGASPGIIPDHDYQRKEHSYSFFGRPEPSASITIPCPPQEVKRSFSWQPYSALGAKSLSPPSRAIRTNLFSSSASPKTHQHAAAKAAAHHKKARGDVKKCRKVYGMENRDLWCTQCKWKKACSRFHDGH